MPTFTTVAFIFSLKYLCTHLNPIFCCFCSISEWIQWGFFLLMLVCIHYPSSHSHQYTFALFPASSITLPCFFPSCVWGLCVFFGTTFAWNWRDTLQFGASVMRGNEKDDQGSSSSLETAFVNLYMYRVHVSDLLLPSPNMTLLKRWQNISIMQPLSSLL